MNNTEKQLVKNLEKLNYLLDGSYKITEFQLRSNKAVKEISKLKAIRKAISTRFNNLKRDWDYEYSTVHFNSNKVYTYICKTFTL